MIKLNLQCLTCRFMISEPNRFCAEMTHIDKSFVKSVHAQRPTYLQNIYLDLESEFMTVKVSIQLSYLIW